MLPFHPSIAHLPIVLSLLIPALILAFIFMMRTSRMSSSAWLIIICLQSLVTGFGYLALETGEVEEEAVQRIVDKQYINRHEEIAEIFVGASVIALVIGVVAFFIEKELQLPLQIATLLISLGPAAMGIWTGNLGGDLVFKHGAAEIYRDKK